jgi:cell division septation protein DedD
MDDKTNLYVFEKKEVFLIFIFMILIAITSFVLGVKIGKTFTYPQLDESLSREQSPVANQSDLSFQSEREEQVNELSDMTLEESDLDTTARLRETLVQEIAGAQTPAREEEPAVVQAPEPSEQVEEAQPDLTGKWTIQLASFPQLTLAQDFAAGFKARGQNTIIREVNLPSRGGIWYRVSLGLFDSSSQALEFMRSNRELLDGEKDATPMQL